MATMPIRVTELLDRALVAELTVVDATGRPVTYPLIPLYDGERVYMTSSTLFSRKLEHIRANPKVSVSITDPTAVDGRTDRVDAPRRLVADPRGQCHRLQVLARPEHSLGAIEANRLDFDPHLVRSGFSRRQILDAKNLWSTGLVKANHPCHAASP